MSNFKFSVGTVTSDDIVDSQLKRLVLLKLIFLLSDTSFIQKPVDNIKVEDNLRLKNEW